MGGAHPNLVPYRAFEASDGWFAIGVGTEESVAQTRGGVGTGRARALEGQQRPNRRANGGGIRRSSDRLIAGPSLPRRVAEGHPVRTGQHRQRSVARTCRQARGGLVEHEGVMTLASPLRFIQPSKENSEV